MLVLDRAPKILPPASSVAPLARLIPTNLRRVTPLSTRFSSTFPLLLLSKVLLSNLPSLHRPLFLSPLLPLVTRHSSPLCCARHLQLLDLRAKIVFGFAEFLLEPSEQLILF